MSGLPPVAEALLAPEVYPERPERVELIQTHLSFVFLAGQSVYKVKKPVNFGFVDFTTVERRRYFCQQEVELNRRLAPTVYLGVVEITRGEDGRLALGGEGETVEYAVHMKRLPMERTLDRLLERREATAAMLDEVARKLVDFHRSSRGDQEVASFGDIPTIAQNTEENFAQVERYVGISIPPHAQELIKAYTRAFLKEKAPLFKMRLAQGRIRDCHGDLHSAHICLADEVYIFDCIEFNDRFRYCDVASEVAFLAMDLDYHGRPDLASRFVQTYVELSEDEGLPTVLDFYKCYRAYVRGKVESLKLDDPAVPEEEKAEGLARAQRYFELACTYASAEGCRREP